MVFVTEDWTTGKLAGDDAFYENRAGPWSGERMGSVHYFWDNPRIMLLGVTADDQQMMKQYFNYYYNKCILQLCKTSNF
jgi:hypothetical protein